MKVKKVLRNVRSIVFFGVVIGDITVQVIQGKAYVLSIIADGLLCLGLLLCGIAWIIYKIVTYKAHKIYKERFTSFKDSSELYFSGKKAYKEYLEELKDQGAMLIRYGEERLQCEEMSRKMRNEIQKIIDETKTILLEV